jgi:hypothetical protein
MSNMPPDYPTSDDFAAASVRTHVARWEFHRGPGSGGKNFGENHYLPEKGLCLVDYDIEVTSDHRTKGSPVYALVKEDLGWINAPVGVGVGHRLTPQGPGGAGAAFTGYIHMKYVSLADWLIVVAKKLNG